jgi:hypothetical protein
MGFSINKVKFSPTHDIFSRKNEFLVRQKDRAI